MHDSYQQYTAQQREGETMRETESRALLNCARRLETVRDPACDYEDYVGAIRHNQRLWTIFQVAITEPNNPLPLEIKRNLLILSAYIDRTSFKAIAKHSPDLLRSLISINRHIAAGLAQKPESQSDAAQSAQTSL